MASPRSTRRFRQEALEIAARTDLRPVDRVRLLDMLRLECSMFLRANKAPDPPPEPAPVRKVKLKPPSQKYLEREARWNGHRRPEVRAKRAEGGRMAYPRMMAVLARRREKAERLAERRRRRQIAKQEQMEREA